MGIFRRLLGLPDTDFVDDLVGSIGRNTTLVSAPHDDQLWQQAQAAKGHVSPKAVSDEYDRLILAKYGRR